jgi:hypothetical protein
MPPVYAVKPLFQYQWHVRFFRCDLTMWVLFPLASRPVEVAATECVRMLGHLAVLEMEDFDT